MGKIPDGETWVVRSVDGAYEVHDADGAVVGGKTWGGPASDLFATYADHGARVTVPEGGATYNRGTLEFNLTACAQRLFAPVDRCGSRSRSTCWGSARCRAAGPPRRCGRKRSRLGASRSTRSGSTACSRRATADLTDGSNDQVYIGWDKEGGLDGHALGQGGPLDGRVDRDVQGRVALTVFTASDGGHTEDLNVQWGTPLSRLPVPGGRLRSRRLHGREPVDRLERGSSRPGAHPVARPVHGRHRRGVGVRQDRLVGCPAGSRMPSCTGPKGTACVSGHRAPFRALALPDDRVWINADKNVVGAIRSKYDTLMCEPGLPTSTSKSLPGGARQTFQSGAIYRNGALDRDRLAEGTGLPGVPGRRRGARGCSACPWRIRSASGSTRRDVPGRLLPRRFRARTHLLEGWDRRLRPVGERARLLQRPRWRRPARSGSRRPGCRRRTMGRPRRRSSTGRSRAERRDLQDVLIRMSAGGPSSLRPGCPQARCSCTGTRR